jgi:hypothetical protein
VNVIDMKEKLSWYRSVLRKYGVTQSRAAGKIQGKGRAGPYKLKPPLYPKTNDEWKNLDPSAAFEFFRIESWLRSKEVLAYYKKRNPALDVQHDIGGISMVFLPYYLGGEHHELLQRRRNKQPWNPKPFMTLGQN